MKVTVTPLLAPKLPVSLCKQFGVLRTRRITPNPFALRETLITREERTPSELPRVLVLLRRRRGSAVRRAFRYRLTGNTAGKHRRGLHGGRGVPVAPRQRGGDQDQRRPADHSLARDVRVTAWTDRARLAARVGGPDAVLASPDSAEHHRRPARGRCRNGRGRDGDRHEPPPASDQGGTPDGLADHTHRRSRRRPVAGEHGDDRGHRARAWARRLDLRRAQHDWYALGALLSAPRHCGRRHRRAGPALRVHRPSKTINIKRPP